MTRRGLLAAIFGVIATSATGLISKAITLCTTSNLNTSNEPTNNGLTNMHHFRANDGEWHHIARVENPDGSVIMYLDGEVDPDQTWLEISDQEVIFDVRTYNRSLNQERVLEIWHGNHISALD